MNLLVSKLFQGKFPELKRISLFCLILGIGIVSSTLQKANARVEPPCNVCQGNITLNTQTQVNAFNCTEITGNLTIDGASITDLFPLNGLLKIGGNLRVTNTQVFYLDGLENLENLGGDLYIRNNDQMVLFFSAAFERGVKFKFNTLNGSLTIFDNNNLLSMGGLGNFKTIKGFMDVFSNASLTNLQGLENLEEIQTLKNSPLALQFVGNRSLSRFFALNKLRKIGGALNIVNNALQSLEELGNLEILEGSLQIIGNNFLDECCSIAHLVAKASQNADIKVNANGCNSTSEVIFGCGAFSVKAFQLINTQNKQVIQTLKEGDVINLQELGDILINFRAITQPNQVGSVKFSLSGAQDINRTENLLPYELFGDAGGKLSPGKYTLKAVPHSAAQGSGTTGQALSINFEVVDTKICQGNITLRTQEEVNQCNCAEVTGNLTIDGQDIVDLFPLNKLRKIGGNLNVRNTNISYLDGLGNVEFLGGDFDIRNNYELILLFSAAIEQGLKFKLDTIGGSLSFIANSKLFSVAGLDNVKIVRGFVDLIANADLLDLRGLRNLEEIQNNVNSHVGLQIFSAGKLFHLGGLEKLRKIEGDLIIVGTALSSLEELKGVEFLKGGLQIEGNNRLNDCCGIAHLLSKATGKVDIENNAGGCNTPSEITFKCGTFSVDSFQLINAQNQQVISPLQDGSVIDLFELGDILLNLRALTKPGQVGSVRMVLTGTQSITRTENMIPYEIFGDAGGKLKPGKYTLEATPYSEALGKGVVGKALKINFELIQKSPCIGDIVLNTQEQVDAFTCESVEGNLTITGSVAFLNALSSLKSIKGNLHIVNTTSLISLDGLQNLEFLGGDFYIRNNTALSLPLSGAFENGDAFKLTEIGGSLTVFDNPQLLSMGGFRKVKNIKGFVDIIDNDEMSNLQGLDGLETIGKAFTSSLQIFGNFRLARLDGLGKLRSMSGNLNISSNANLLFLDDLAQLGSIGGTIKIAFNNRLDNCCGIARLVAMSPEKAEIQGNAVGCNTIQELFTACDTYKIDRLLLVNAHTKAILDTLTQGDTIDLSLLKGAPLNIRALSLPTKVGSVVFKLQGTQNLQRTENLMPYEIFGDTGGSLAPGTYSLEVIPFTLAQGQGQAGAAFTLQFLVADGLGASKTVFLEAYPNPSEDKVKLKVIKPNTEAGELIIYNTQGKIIYQKTVTGEFEDEISLLEFGKGLYVAKFIRNGQEEFQKIMIK
ncbi:MAG: T9SS type A sorting domain-containing protein [Microscillaceae bacterium]|nr:T9SS type A sorting domain-containing protein [Microscillaceae bacterium]